MIYLTDGKITVRDGKLCKTCCPPPWPDPPPGGYGDNCLYCPTDGKTPKYIRVTLSGLSESGCDECRNPFPDSYYKFYGVAGLLNGLTVTLVQDHDGVGHCMWQDTITARYCYAEAYWDSGCEDPIDDPETNPAPLDNIKYEIRKKADNVISAAVFVSNNPFTLLVFKYEGTPSHVNNCLGVTLDNEYTACSAGPPYIIAAHGGKMTIEEGDDT